MIWNTVNKNIYDSAYAFSYREHQWFEIRRTGWWVFPRKNVSPRYRRFKRFSTQRLGFFCISMNQHVPLLIPWTSIYHLEWKGICFLIICFFVIYFFVKCFFVICFFIICFFILRFFIKICFFIKMCFFIICFFLLGSSKKLFKVREKTVTWNLFLET